MAKHLSPRGSALPPWRATLLPALMWLILLTVFPARLHAQRAGSVNEPSGDNIKTQPITVLNYIYVELQTLIKEGVVEGIEVENAANYVTSCDSSSVQCSGNYFRPNKAGDYNIVYTNLNDSTITFNLDVTVVNGVNVISALKPVIVGQSITITNGEDAMPLRDYTDIYLKSLGDVDPSSIAEMKIDYDNNEILVNGVGVGQVALYMATKYGDTFVRLNVQLPKITVLEDSILIPTNNPVQLYRLIEEKVVEGVMTSSILYDSQYNLESSDPDIVNCSSGSGSFYFKSPGTATITYTNKKFPESKFSITFTAKPDPGYYVRGNLGTVYVGESKTLVIPDIYMPLDYYKSVAAGKYYDEPDADYTLKVDGNQLTFTGVDDGVAQLNFVGKLTNSTVQVKIETKMATIEENEDGEATAGSQLDVPVAVDLPEDIKPDEGMEIVCVSADPDIAEVKIDSESGIITIIPKGLGVTYIIVSQQPIKSDTPEPQARKAAQLSRAGEEDALYTIEFWVTELELAEEMTLTAGSSEQLIYTIYAGEDPYPEKRVNPVWSSSNTAVATVDSDGNVTALSEGTAVITLTTGIGTRQTIVTVEPDDTPAGKLTINPSHVALTVGGRIGLSTEGSGGKTVKWTTSNSFAATVSETGVVTAVGVGSAVITATVEGTSLKASANVTVFERTTGIEAAEATEPVITVEDLTVIISGVAADIPVEIYNVSGRLVASRNGSCSVAVGQSGIYIVRIGGIARKVAVTH